MIINNVCEKNIKSILIMEKWKFKIKFLYQKTKKGKSNTIGAQPKITNNK